MLKPKTKKETKGISHGLVSEIEDKEKLKLYKNIFRVKKYTDDYLLEEVLAIDTIIYDPNEVESEELYNDDKLILYGSHIYKGNVLAGDIDLMQIIKIEEQAKALQWVFNNLLFNPAPSWAITGWLNSTFFLGDIKCGIVSKFKSLSTHIGNYNNGRIEGYNYEAVKYSFNLSNDLTENNLTIPKKIESREQFIEYLKIYELAHSLFTRRWTPKEIIDGYQVDDDGTKYYLNNAVYESELTKYDAYYFSNNRYVEITNTLMKESDQTKKKTDSFTNGVKLNMLIQYYAKDNKLKALKRLYALSRMEKNVNLTLLLHDFTQRSLVGKYNQVINDLKVFMYILENYSNTFSLNPNNYRVFRLGTHITSIQSLIQKMYNPYDMYLTKIIKFIDEEIYRTKVIRYGEQSAVKNALDYCNKIIDYFSEKIDKACTEFIKVNNIDFEKYL